MKESILTKNIFGAKGYYDLNVIAKNEDKTIIIIKTWNGVLKKLSFNEKENCYIVVDEKT